MKTDNLITALVADLPQHRADFGRILGIALAAGIAVSFAAFWMTLAPRSDFLASIGTFRFDAKLIVTLLLAALALAAVSRLAIPGRATGTALALLVLVPLIVGASVLLELVVLPPSAWAEAWIGENASKCLTAIPLLSIPILGALLFALRNGAATRPMLTGAVAGLVAGGFAALFYAMHCPDDSPLFVATWYSIAIAGVSFVGALAARHLLRW